MTDSQRWLLLFVFLLAATLIYLLQPILSPFLAGMLLAYISDPVVDRLEYWGLSRIWAVIIVFVGFSVLVGVLLVLLLPLLGHQIDALAQWLPRLAEWISEVMLPWLKSTLGVGPELLSTDQLKKILQLNWMKGGDLLAHVLSQATASGLALAAWLANLVLIPVVTFYLLRDWDLMIVRIRRLLPLNLEPRVSRWTAECDEVLGAFIKGQLLVMLILGGIYAIGLSLIGLDLALLVGLLAGVASIVPYMGVIIGLLAAGIAAFMQFHDVWHLGLVAAIFGGGQLLEGMLLTPLLVGDKIGLHPVAVIFAIMAGGQLFGFTGILMALPVAAVIMVLLRHLHEGYVGSALYHADDREQQTEEESG